MDADMHNQPTEPQHTGNTSNTVPLPASGQMIPPPPPVALVLPKRRVSRRALIGASVAGLAGLGIVGGIGLDEWIQHGGLSDIFHAPPSSDVQTGHLLRRAGFGANPTELAMYRNLGFSGAVDRLLNYSQVSEDDTEKRLSALKLDLNKPVDQQQWWLMRMAWTQRPLLEKMTLFWHGVLTSSFRKVGGRNAYMRMMMQNQFLREHAFDTFDNILLGITADPAMLFYLDLTKSTKTVPNENYARELMELFTLGLGNYTQQDVSEGAASLTGWHVRGLKSVYVPQTHNDLAKRYLGQTGNFDYKDVMRILASHPATPWFLSRKLFTFFVYENPSADDLKPLVDTYVQSGHNMGAVMRTLLTSPQFSSAKAYRSRVKSPTEFAVGAVRALNVQDSGAGLPNYTTLMGQTLFDPPNVAGWPADKVSALWLNSGTWMMRLNYIDALLVRGTFTRGKTVSPINLQMVVDANSISSPQQFVDYFTSFLLDGEVTSERRTQFINYLTTPDSSSGARVTLKGGSSYPLGRVRGTLYLVMASPEYQLD